MTVLATEFREFANISEMIKPIDEEISKVRSMLGDYLRKLDESKLKSDKIKKARTAIAKIAGTEIDIAPSSKELDIMGLKIIINPTPEDEALALEEIVKDLQERLTTLQRVRKSLEPLTTMDVEVGIVALMKDNIPVKIFVKLK